MDVVKKRCVIAGTAVLLAGIGAYIGIVVMPSYQLKPKPVPSQEEGKAASKKKTASSESSPSKTPVAENALSFDTYSGYFVSNQFEADAPESFVVLKTQKAFDGVFGVAAVMNDRSHRLAANAFGANVVLAAIKRAKAVCEFKVESVSVNDGVVTLRYTATSKKSDTASFACPLIVSIPLGEYRAVEFVENGKMIKRLSF